MKSAPRSSFKTGAETTVGLGDVTGDERSAPNDCASDAMDH